MVSGKQWVHSSAAAGGVTLVDCDVDLIDGKKQGAIQLNFVIWAGLPVNVAWSSSWKRYVQGPCFSKVPTRFGPISGATIPFISSQR